MVWGGIVLFILPDTIYEAKFLDSAEIAAAEARVSNTVTGITASERDEWKWKEALRCLLEPMTWFFFSISIFTDVRIPVLLLSI